MNATAALTAVPSTETFGLSPEKAAHLIGKLRAMPAEQRALFITTKDTQ